MSKNVAVFVDVANIFYAAKAGGVDIDYVTLLKSAVAGRDFVRAYAYTGLDPENENQRQFHAFLARSGYKVVSKDIRKYGDGRIKANLDIELVVDLMRLARNLDIAIVVSGDGDFAPAIRAVQQMGVRVEVISFRGNTSSDLIEVADQFTDIAQVARVDKSSARSGRRVAAEGDLSMTAVPEKETEGAPRRRRGRPTAAERAAERAAEKVAEPADDGGMTGNLIVLPGERLSRAPEDEEAAQPAAGAAGEAGADETDEAGDRRRRRRRGGRGRGRGRRDEGQPAERLAGEPAEDEEDEEFEDLAPTQPAHHAFGSVWDSQIGVPSALPAASAGGYVDEEDEDLDEPEIPEYLLAERRQRQRPGARGRMGPRGGRQGAYQAAIERERYGRSGGGAGGFGGSRLAERPRQDRSRGGRGNGGQRPPRADRPPMSQRPPTEQRSAGAGSGADPWSEVPEELEQMLRAELARKAGPAGAPAASDEPSGAAERAPADAEQKPKRASRARTRPADAAADESAQAAEAAGGQAEAKPKRATRSRTAKPADAEDKPKRATRARAKSADSDAAAEPAAASATDEAPAKPKRASRAKAKPAADEAEG